MRTAPLLLLASCALPDFEKVEALPIDCSSPAAPPPSQSCDGAAAGDPRRMCGENRDQDCCETLPLPCGSYKRGFDGAEFSDDQHPATVPGFHLDRFEVTVARFRAWVDAGAPGPPDKSGAPPGHPEGDWNDNWDVHLPSGTDEVKAALTAGCEAPHTTWTATPGNAEAEAKAMTCPTWYMAFAFCVWDGGRLPTEAEWNYAAAGGAEQRVFPWSVPPSNEEIFEPGNLPDEDPHAAWDCDITFCGIGERLTVPGSFPRGRGRFGHDDLGGNLAEWVRDSAPWTIVDRLDVEMPNPNASYVAPCDDGCVDVRGELMEGGEPGQRAFRGGFFGSTHPSELKASSHFSVRADEMYYAFGVRCARDPAP